MFKHFIKPLGDFFIALFLLIILSPIILLTAILLFLANNGKVFFFQQRPGLNSKPFRIVKFKTMRDAFDKDGIPLPDDVRLTKFGGIVRSASLDELLQLINVLKGDMSFVGPRPERQFYIDQISEKDPQYLYLHKVRPGITSWGQVKYGYAENVDEMVQRMKYDLLYIRNMTLSLDFKIMFYTVKTVLEASGK